MTPWAGGSYCPHGRCVGEGAREGTASAAILQAIGSACPPSRLTPDPSRDSWKGHLSGSAGLGLYIYLPAFPHQLKGKNLKAS